jgi:hypothetical protein
VIDDAEREVCLAGLVGFAGAVHAPHAVGVAETIGAFLELLVLKPDIGLMVAQLHHDRTIG